MRAPLEKTLYPLLLPPSWILYQVARRIHPYRRNYQNLMQYIARRLPPHRQIPIRMTRHRVKR
jgi:predicted SprT family Zn-dependent metalloprotease